jgi:hypothetical protein
MRNRPKEKKWSYRGVEISIDSNKRLKYVTRSASRSLLNFVIVPLLNVIPGKFSSAVKRSHRGAHIVIEKAASHEAIEALYQSGYPHLSKNFLEEFARWLWFGTDCGLAAQNRLVLVREKIVSAIHALIKRDMDINILSIASGSARAIVEAVVDSNIPKNIGVSITFLDKNPEALKYSTHLAEALPKEYKLRWIEDTASNFPKHVNGLKPNIVEMVGLLDYFDEKQVIKVLSTIHENIADGGTMIIANISDNRERKFVTNLVGWKMIYRDAENLIDLAEQSGFELGKMRAIYEPLGIHHILIAIK